VIKGKRGRLGNRRGKEKRELRKCSGSGSDGGRKVAEK